MTDFGRGKFENANKIFGSKLLRRLLMSCVPRCTQREMTGCRPRIASGSSFIPPLGRTQNTASAFILGRSHDPAGDDEVPNAVAFAEGGLDLDAAGPVAVDLLAGATRPDTSRGARHSAKSSSIFAPGATPRPRSCGLFSASSLRFLWGLVTNNSAELSQTIRWRR